MPGAEVTDRKQPSKPTPRWAKLNEAAAYFHCHPKTMRGYVTQGLLPSAGYVGKKRALRIDLNEVDALVEPLPAPRRAS